MAIWKRWRIIHFKSSDVYFQPVNIPEPPVAIFSGIPKTNKPIFGRWFEDEYLFPGDQLNYKIFNSKKQKWEQYSIFAEGRVVKSAANAELQPTGGLEDYAVWLQVVDILDGQPDRSRPVREQCLYNSKTTTSSDPRYVQGVFSLYFIGDLDGDEQLDLILGDPGRGYNYQLYLSSQANPGFLLKIVAQFIDYYC